jgi:hypothetical protein
MGRSLRVEYPGAVYHRYGGLGNAEVGKIFGGIHYSGVSKASERLKEEMASDKKLVNLMNEVISQFKA